MGINTENKRQSKNVNKVNGEYKVDNMIFPTRFVYSTIASIDRNLRILYSEVPPSSLWQRMNYSGVRDDKEEFCAILDRVEERTNRIDGRVKIEETSYSAFNIAFHGIMDFLYEAGEFEGNEESYRLSKKTPEYIKKRFIDLARRMWEMNISPNEFEALKQKNVLGLFLFY